MLPIENDGRMNPKILLKEEFVEDVREGEDEEEEGVDEGNTDIDGGVGSCGIKFDKSSDKSMDNDRPSMIPPLGDISCNSNSS